MTMSRLVFAALAIALASDTALAQGQPPLPPDSLERARRYMTWFKEAKTDSLWPHVVPGIGGALSSSASLAAMSAEFRTRAGTIRGVVEERFAWRGGNRQFWQTLDASDAPEPILLRWVLGADGRIRGMGLTLLSEAPPVDSGGPVIKRP
jgi:hypothetical protein